MADCMNLSSLKALVLVVRSDKHQLLGVGLPQFTIHGMPN
jgi:hypothetical protein